MDNLDYFPAGTRMEEARLPSGLRMRWYQRGPARAPVVFVFQLPRFPEWLLGRDPERNLARVFRKSAVQRDVFTPEVLAPYLRQVRERGLPGLHDYRAATRPSFRKPVPPAAIVVPTRLIWGLGDAVLGPWLAEPERYRSFVRDFDRVVIEDAGHWVQQEAAARVNAALAEHFERH